MVAELKFRGMGLVSSHSPLAKPDAGAWDCGWYPESTQDKAAILVEKHVCILPLLLPAPMTLETKKHPGGPIPLRLSVTCPKPPPAKSTKRCFEHILPAMCLPANPTRVHPMKSILLALLALTTVAQTAAAQTAAAQTAVAPTAAVQTPPDRDGLLRYAAANQALPAPRAGRPRVVLLGNSITKAWPKADSAFFAGSRYELVGRGISGQTSPQLLVRFRQDVIDLHPVAVVLLAGINDIAGNTGPYDPQATFNNIQSMAELAQAHGIRVILCSVLPAYDFPWRPGLAPAPKVLAVNQQIKDYAARHRCTYLDYHAAMADERQGLPAALATDGVHPTLAGYRLMEPLLEQAVAKALRGK